MKITWFAGTTFRIQIAGQIVVTNPDGAPEHINPTELVSGAGIVVSAAREDVPVFESSTWAPRRRGRMIDEDGADPVLNLYRLGADGFVADSEDEGLLVLDDHGAHWGRWADNAVVVLSGRGTDCAERGLALLTVARPRLIALAVEDGDIDTAFSRLAAQLGDASLIMLEAGMAVEV